MMSLGFQKPRMSIVRDCRAMLAYYSNIHLRLLMIGSLKSDLNYLWRYFFELDQNASDVLRKASNYLDIAYVASAVEDWHKHADTADSEAYEVRLRDVLENVRFQVSAWCHELERSLINLSSFSYTGNHYRLRQLRESVANLRKVADLSAKDANYEDLLRREKKLNLAIEAYEDQSVFSQVEPILKQVAGTLQSSAQADTPAAFKKEMIVGGVQVALSLLKLAADTVTYENMIEARDKTRDAIAGVQKELGELQFQVGECYAEISLIEDFDSLQGARFEFVAEVEAIFMVYLDFLEGFERAPGPEQGAAHFLGMAPRFERYVNDVLRIWGRC